MSPSSPSPGPNPSPDELASRYGDVYRKTDRIELAPERFERGIERGDDGAWGAGALVVDGSRALFVREDDTWLLPGGHLEPGESPREGARREVLEETGVDVDVCDLAAIAEQTFVCAETGDSYEFYFATFLAEPAPGTAADASDERIDEVAWLGSVPERTFDGNLVRRLFDEHVR